PINLQILYKTLEGSGYRLLVAKNGETALEIVQRASPSLVLLDVMMPGMDGFEVCQRLKGSPETANVAVIFLSALGDSQAKVRGFAVGGNDYIAKPFQADEVVARVRTHIKIHRLEPELARRNTAFEAENQQILYAPDGGIIVLEADGRVPSINPDTTRMTGWPAADVISEVLRGLPIFQNISGGEGPGLVSRPQTLGHKTHSAMATVRRGDGTFLP